MFLFIDTANLLHLYELSPADLAEVDKVLALGDGARIQLILPFQVRDEFLRQREPTIHRARRDLENHKIKPGVPNLFFGYEQREAMLKASDEADKAKAALLAKADEDISKNSLAADKLVQRLFDSVDEYGRDSEHIAIRARLRHDRGNPPGAAGNLGDAINWECLLDAVPQGEDLHLISGNTRDYASPLDKAQPQEFLAHEWSAHKGATLHYYPLIDGFLRRNYPKLRLADEATKHLAIEELAESWSFRDTHDAVARLERYTTFTHEEKERLLQAICENSQIYQIVGDRDVKEFAARLLSSLEPGELSESAEEVEKMLQRNRPDNEFLAEDRFPDTEPFPEEEAFPPEEDLPF